MNHQTTPALETTPALVVIPARYGAQRFPGKPLKMLAGQTVVERVAQAALQARADAVIVATEDERIAQAVRAAFADGSVRVAMTSENCQTGTERIAQAVAALQAENAEYSGDDLIVVNAQGDEPFVNPQHIELLIDAMRAEPALQMATCATPMRDENQIHDPNFVKVVCARNGDALYFSRSPIPLVREGDLSTQQLIAQGVYWRHMGLYAYRAAWLKRMAALSPTPLEESEKLEQLRALENGVAIRVLPVERASDIAIDTPHDLERAVAYLQTQEGAQTQS